MKTISPPLVRLAVPGLCLVLALGFLLGPVPTAYAATIQVPCDVPALVNALDKANANAEADTLELAPACTYSLTAVNNTDATLGPNGLPVITTDIKLNGNSATISRDSTTAPFRIFQVNAGATLTLNQLALRGGDPGAKTNRDAYDGGAIHNKGTCILNHTTVDGNQAGDGKGSISDYLGLGGHGGGIFNDGVVALTDSIVSNNHAGRGGVGYGPYVAAPGGHGGAVYNLGTLTLIRTTVIDNSTATSPTTRHGATIGAGGGIYNLGTLTATASNLSGNHTGDGTGYFTSSVGGNGGAIYNAGELDITNSNFANNRTGTILFGDASGSGGAIYNDISGHLSFGNSQMTNNTSSRGGRSWGTAGSGGDGGGIANAGTAQVDNSVFEFNATGRGGGASYPPSGDGGRGGGIFNSGILSVAGTTFRRNQTGEGEWWEDGSGSGGNGGSGGGIFNDGMVTVRNSTLSQNLTGDGNFGIPNGFGGNGGGIANQGTLTLLHVTLDGNRVGTKYHSGKGGAVANESGTVVLQNTIIANSPTGGNCFGTIDDGGGNLRYPKNDPSCVGKYGKPSLGQLQDNGGATQTIALAPDSAAINLALDANCLATDQRGFARPQGKHCDSGAFELEMPTTPALRAPDDGKKLEYGQANLRWNAGERVGWYRILVRQDSATGPDVVKIRLTRTEYQTPLLDSGHWYYWRVKACSNVGCRVSDWWRFRVK